MARCAGTDAKAARSTGPGPCRVWNVRTIPASVHSHWAVKVTSIPSHRRNLTCAEPAIRTSAITASHSTAVRSKKPASADAVSRPKCKSIRRLSWLVGCRALLPLLILADHFFQLGQLSLRNSIRLQQIDKKPGRRPAEVLLQQCRDRPLGHIVLLYHGLEDKHPAARCVPHKAFILHDSQKCLRGLIVRPVLLREVVDDLLDRGLAQLPDGVQNAHLTCSGQIGAIAKWHGPSRRFDRCVIAAGRYGDFDS